MRALAVKPDERSIESVDLNMQANTLYTYFSSILIDELRALHKHIIYTDANALANHKQAYFIGEQLVIGEALLFGQNGMEDVDVTITQEELASLINYELPHFYKQALLLLAKSDVNLYKQFYVTKNSEKIALNGEWVLYTFNIADEATQKYFLNELAKVIDENKSVEAYLQKMAQLAMNVVS
jgi:hypothetical protein